MQVLHLGEEIAEWFGVQATPTAAGRGPRTLGRGEGRFVEHAYHPLVPLVAKTARVDAYPLRDHSLLKLVGTEKLVDTGPEAIHARLHTTMTLLGTVTQAPGPAGGMVLVVVDLLDRFARDSGDGRVDRVGQPRVEQTLVCGEEELPGDGLREVAVGLFDELNVNEVALIPEKSEVVLGPARGLDLPRVRQQDAGLTEQVESDVGERDVFLELRGIRRPLAESLGEDERVVAQPQCILRDRWQLRGRCAAHRCSTPSGRS